MKKSTFTESQIIGILKQQALGKPVNDICREHCISQTTRAGDPMPTPGLG
jgi:hypothetical protein